MLPQLLRAVYCRHIPSVLGSSSSSSSMTANETETIALAAACSCYAQEERSGPEMLIDLQFALTRSPKDVRVCT